jgi:hypothetical protein
LFVGIDEFGGDTIIVWHNNYGVGIFVSACYAPGHLGRARGGFQQNFRPRAIAL